MGITIFYQLDKYKFFFFFVKLGDHRQQLVNDYFNDPLKWAAYICIGFTNIHIPGLLVSEP